ncbi:MAG: M28 family peptidase [Victivallaceae bacterium]|nr:M28 family peptidase [Victivallaceae bacterium]
MKKLLLLLVLLAGCSPDAPEHRFDRARAWRHADKLVGFGQRVAGSDELRMAGDYILAELASASVHGERQEFDENGIRFCNIIATIPGRESDRIVMISCHYDLKKLDPPMDGANDGASAAAVLLELARQLRTPQATIMLVWFDGEECQGARYTDTDGLNGSRRLAEAMAEDGRLSRVSALLNADMVGLPDVHFTLPANTDLTLYRALKAAAERQQMGSRISFYDGNILDDHEPFRRRGVRTLNLIAFNDPAWHTPGDNLKHISPDSLSDTGKLILGFIDELQKSEPR